MWIKKNWFKLGLLVVLSILAIAIYPIYKYWRSQSDASNSLRLAQQCSKDGEKLFEADQKEAVSLQYTNGATQCFYMDPEYIFSQKLNTCLYSGGYTCNLTHVQTSGIFAGNVATRWTRHIINVYTNQSVAQVSVDDTASVTDFEAKAVDDFWNESTKLGL